MDTTLLTPTPAMLITLAMLHTPAIPLMPHTLLTPTPPGTGTLLAAMAMLATAPPLATCTTGLLAMVSRERWTVITPPAFKLMGGMLLNITATMPPTHMLH